MLSIGRKAAQQVARKAIPLSTKSKTFESIHTTSQSEQMPKGEVFQKQPVKVRMEEGQTYNWCACGLSKKQPFCDGSHKNSRKGIVPIHFVPGATKEYELCNFNIGF
ncbi:unnamed protein product [Allacma fusca]|uniref:Iron-binding zinc finger CDGSH type domain-containing protein n=1 Tax=Allacma fusca TaxID=39272 RepID=A0A8J2JHR9_9HEXA|nr:unnamed protein product [Allacma fusca]